MSIPDGNWTELRRLVMKLLEEHEGAISRMDTILDKLSKAQVVDHALLDEVRKYVFGQGGVWTALKLMDHQIVELERRIEAKFAAAEELAAAAKEAAEKLESRQTGLQVAKSNWKILTILGAAVTALAAGLGKVLDLLGQLVGAS